ncbi:MAG TPA: hypothetical protein DEH78_10030 [Solibacterales bacterium]|nr:hypothetical protein [Bryobacterales bacterium]
MAKRIVWTNQAKAGNCAIEQPIAIRILKTLGRYVLTGEGAINQLKGVTPPLIRLRAHGERPFLFPLPASASRHLSATRVSIPSPSV